MNPRLLRPFRTGTVTPSGTPASLLLHFDGDFTDSSANALTVTAEGSADIDQTIVKFGTHSAYFDGDTDFLSTPYNAALDFGSGDFTVEFWMYWTGGHSFFSWSVDHQIGILADYASASDNRLCLLASSDGENWNLFTVDIGGGDSGVSSAPAPKNTWCHVAVTRKGDKWRMFIDGSQVFEGTRSESLASPEGLSFQIGTWADVPGLEFEGYMDDFRVTKGLAVYTGPFTPPTAPLSPYATPVPVSREASLLLHLDGNLDDASPNHVTVQAYGGVNPSQNAKFNGSAVFNGTDGYLSIASQDAINLTGEVPYTIEFWMYIESYSNNYTTVLTRRSGNWQYLLGFSEPTTTEIFFSANSQGDGYSQCRSGFSLPLQEWVHIAATVNNGTARLFVNGILADTQAWATQSDNSYDLFIGQQGSSGEWFNGYVDELRIVKGLAVYTGPFTPPTAPLSAMALPANSVAAVYGCTNPSSANYNPAANANDGSCCPAYGTFLREECQGPDSVNVYADGECGEYSEVANAGGCE